MDAYEEGGEGRVRHEQKLFILLAMAYGDDRGVLVRRRMTGKREALVGTGMIESGGYAYPNKSIRISDPIAFVHEGDNK